VPRILDLFCGAGGAGAGYARAGFEVVGVDIVPQPHYPFEIVVADALELTADDLAAFDAVHASPPCPAYSLLQNIHGNAEDHPDLIGPVRRMLEACGRPWILENVEGAPLRADFILCGTMFGLEIAKHRVFELGFPAFALMPPCEHIGLYDPWHGRGRTAARFRQVQETPWIPIGGGAKRKRGETGDLFNAIPPAYTEFLGRLLLEHLAGAARPEPVLSTVGRPVVAAAAAHDHIGTGAAERP
jgi:DNA (cytosine-5)-methyltransferase 1